MQTNLIDRAIDIINRTNLTANDQLTVEDAITLIAEIQKVDRFTAAKHLHTLAVKER